MALTNLIKSTSKIKLMIAALISGVVIIAALLFFFNKSAGVTESERQIIEDNPRTESNQKKMSEEDVAEAQKSAALAAITGKPVSGTVTHRPDYVSEIEWDVFQNVIKNQPGSNDMQLTTLVNKLLFFKKKEAWESSGINAAQRRELARGLLEMLPFMTEGGHISAGDSKKLESALYNEIN